MLFLLFSIIADWLPSVSKYNIHDSNHGMAGEYGKAIDLVCVNGGRKYAVHYLGDAKDKWEKPVYGYNIHDSKNGYAGTKGKPIDGFAIEGVTYRAHIKGGNWLNEVYKFDTSASNGYAGVYGKEIDGIAIKGRKYSK